MDNTCLAETPPADSDVWGSRRGFCRKLAAVGLGAIALGAPAGGGVMALLNPLRQRGSGGEFLRLVSLDTLPADGTPCKVPVVAERVDAWTRSVEPVGAVFLRRTAEQQVEALHVVCPHAGCTVELKASKDAASGAKQLTYVCPCHKAYFDTSGKRTDAQSMSPRDLDPLPVEIRNGSEVWVQFQNFKTGTPDRVAVS